MTTFHVAVSWALVFLGLLAAWALFALLALAVYFAT